MTFGLFFVYLHTGKPYNKNPEAFSLLLDFDFLRLALIFNFQLFMMLIAESGSTRTTWCIVRDDGLVETCYSSGINPFFLGAEEIRILLDTEFSLPKVDISSVFFYGAGCAFPDKQQMLFDVLSSCFGTTDLEVNSDLLAAARSLCKAEEGIACILGTGSNSCLYDGKKIVQNTPPLGFILGDEGSGSYLGKNLLSGIFKNQFPEVLRDDFLASYPEMAVSEALENVYRKPFPNRYLAQYAKFAACHINNPDIEKMVENGFSEFLRRNVLQYPGANRLPIHFTGSIAFFFREQLEKILKSFGLTIGTISQEIGRASCRERV